MPLKTCRETNAASTGSRRVYRASRRSRSAPDDQRREEVGARIGSRVLESGRERTTPESRRRVPGKIVDGLKWDPGTGSRRSVLADGHRTAQVGKARSRPSAEPEIREWLSSMKRMG